MIVYVKRISKREQTFCPSKVKKEKNARKWQKFKPNVIFIPVCTF